MSASFKNLIHRAVRGNVSRGLVAAAAVVVLPLAALAAGTGDYTPDSMDHGDHHSSSHSPLVKKVHDANLRFTNINVALSDPTWDARTTCVSGPETGAMGVHLVNFGRTKDGIIDPEAPEALIYEPLPNGYMRLVGVEFIQDAADWAARNPKSPPPSLDGQLMNLVGAPNRFGLDPFYELHVWAFEDNPLGAFADWNTHVTCEKQRLVVN